MKALRKSNIEALRLISMFFVLIIHANFLSKTTLLSLEAPITVYTQFFFASISFTCVNIFVLISGWFGISFKVKGLCSFLFQCYFWSVFCCVLSYIIEDDKTLNLNVIYTCLMLRQDSYWFVKSYLLLYLLSPLLNTFVEHTTKKQFLSVLISFFVFQTLLGWATYAVNFFESGYSTTSFVGLYLLARYIKLYTPKWCKLSPQKDLGIILLIIIITSTISFISVRLGTKTIWIIIYSYINPIIIFESLLFVVLFNKLHFQKKLINCCATSTFAVYLFHCNDYIFRPYYQRYSQYIFNQWNGIEYLCIIFIFMLSIFVFSILFDKLRIIIWNFLYRIYNHPTY